MQFSRIVFVALVSLGLLSIAVVRADPPTHCSPVVVDAFSVIASPTGDIEGDRLAEVNGTYPTQVYFAALARNYPLTQIFFNIQVSPYDDTNTTGTVGVQFTISLNNLMKTDSQGNPQVFSPNNATGISVVEFTNWLPAAQRSQNNTLALNVTETITVIGPLGPDVTSCSYLYTVIFLNPSPAGTGGQIVGDPQFHGLRGQSYQVHGVDGAVYNLISDKSMQLNSRFSFLEGPRPCAIMPSTGRPSTACWSHPGSYISELALKTIGGSKLQLISGPAADGFASIKLNGKVMKPGETGILSFDGSRGLTGSISFDNTHEVTIHAGMFVLVVENNDGFVNLRQMSVTSGAWNKLQSHGLLGQTWKNMLYPGKIKEIEGDVDDYLIEDDDIFGDSFLFNKFNEQVS